MGISQQGNKFRARITRNGKRITVGTFDTKRKAQLAIARYDKKMDGPVRPRKSTYMKFPKGLNTRFNDSHINESPMPFIKTGIAKTEYLIAPKKSLWQKVKDAFTHTGSDTSSEER